MECRGGRGVVGVRMYPDGWRSLAEGWAKAFADGAAKTRRRTLLLTIAWMSGGMLAFLGSVSSLAAGFPSPWVGLTYLAYAASIHAMLRPIGSFPTFTALAYPGPLIAFFVIFAWSAFLRLSGGRVRWKGRSFATARKGR